MRSTVGRPRRVTDDQIAEILEWHRRRETRRQLAERLQLSLASIAAIIRSGGAHYKQPSPERRATNLAEVHDRHRRLEAAGFL